MAINAEKQTKLRVVAVLVGMLVLVSAIHAAGESGGGKRVSGGAFVAPLPLRIGRAIARSPVLNVTRQQEDGALAGLVERRVPLFCGGRRPYAALTFDDGPSPRTKDLQRELRRAGIPATFFVIGRNAVTRPQSLRRLERDGAVGNHTWNHPDLTKLPPAEIERELSSTKALLSTNPAPFAMMRPPYGARNTLVTKTIDRADYAEILWSADSTDALTAPWKTVATDAIAGLGPGAVILMHDGPASTVPALRHRIIPAIRRSGLTMVTIPELLVLNPPGAERLSMGPRGCRHAGKVNVSGYFARPQGERR